MEATTPGMPPLWMLDMLTASLRTELGMLNGGEIGEGTSARWREGKEGRKEGEKKEEGMVGERRGISSKSMNIYGLNFCSSTHTHTT